MFYRTRKRLIIISIYLLIASFFIFLISRRYLVGPTCFDGAQNQDEQGVDCGGVCESVLKDYSFGGKCIEKLKAKDIEMKEEDIYVIYGGENKYDLAIKVTNLNELYGAKEFEYVINLKNEAGDIVVTRQGKSFLLPTETKYLLEIGLESTEKVTSANVFIKSSLVKWVKFIEYETPKITIQNQKFGLGENDPKYYAKVFGLMVNESLFDFNKIDIKIVIKDNRGIPIAVNKTDKRTVEAGKKYEFTLIFPKEFPGGKNMSSVEIQTEVDIFNNDNFMKKYAE